MVVVVVVRAILFADEQFRLEPVVYSAWKFQSECGWSECGTFRTIIHKLSDRIFVPELKWITEAAE